MAAQSALGRISTRDADTVPAPTRPGFERRAAERFPFTATVRWTSGIGRTVNISATGLLFETDAPVELSTVLKLTIDNPLPDDNTPKYVFCDVVVVRVRPAANDNQRFQIAASIAGMRFR